MEQSERKSRIIGEEERKKPMVIRSSSSSTFHSVVALFIWIGPLPLAIILPIIAIFLFPNPSSFLLLGLMLLLSVIPVDDTSRFGKALESYVGKYAPGYFPITVYIEDVEDFNQDKAYVLAAEPHSVFPIGSLSLLMNTGLMPLLKTKALASTAIFYTPIFRQVATWFGLIPATKANFVNYLKSGYSCIVIPGGVREIMYMDHELEVVYLKARYGFVRVAIETGKPLVPIFSFGQTAAYSWLKPKGKLYIQIARAIRFAPLVFWGAFGSPIPYRKPMHIVVGRPIKTKLNPNPTIKEVSELHTCFVSALEQLFYRYREVAGYANAELKII